jgi:hypothetical protein
VNSNPDTIIPADLPSQAEFDALAAKAAQDTETAENTAEVTSTRTFYRSDYRNAAKLVQSMRHAKGNRYQPKPQADQDKIDFLAVALRDSFALDAPEGAFNEVRFMAGTQLPYVVNPAAQAAAPNVLLDSPPADEGTEDE